MALKSINNINIYYNGLCMVRNPKGMHYKPCCAPFLFFFIAVKLVILVDNFSFCVDFERIDNMYGDYF